MRSSRRVRKTWLRAQVGPGRPSVPPSLPGGSSRKVLVWLVAGAGRASAWVWGPGRVRALCADPPARPPAVPASRPSCWLAGCFQAQSVPALRGSGASPGETASCPAGRSQQRARPGRRSERSATVLSLSLPSAPSPEEGAAGCSHHRRGDSGAETGKSPEVTWAGGPAPGPLFTGTRPASLSDPHSDPKDLGRAPSRAAPRPPPARPPLARDHASSWAAPGERQVPGAPGSGTLSPRSEDLLRPAVPLPGCEAASGAIAGHAPWGGAWAWTGQTSSAAGPLPRRPVLEPQP